MVRRMAALTHLVEEGRLMPAYAAGPGFQVLASLESAVGEGLLGGVATSREPVFNRVANVSGSLAVVLAVAIELQERVTAVLALYRAGPDAFADEDPSLLAAMAPKLAASMDNARRFGRAQRACARALFERLDAEVARTRRMKGRMAVVECALQGLDPEGMLSDRMAGELRSLCREYDFVARSGNAFILVLADFAPASMPEKLARIEAVFQRSGVAAAIGAAFLPENGEDAEALLAAAHGAAQT
jgi:hypothetical protein